MRRRCSAARSGSLEKNPSIRLSSTTPFPRRRQPSRWSKYYAAEAVRCRWCRAERCAGSPGALVEQILARAGRSRSARPRPGRSVPNLRRISCGFEPVSGRLPIQISDIEKSQSRDSLQFRRLRCETPEFPRQRTGSWPLTFGKVGTSGRWECVLHRAVPRNSGFSAQSE
jgi:hypothetical protein